MAMAYRRPNNIQAIIHSCHRRDRISVAWIQMQTAELMRFMTSSKVNNSRGPSLGAVFDGKRFHVCTEDVLHTSDRDVLLVSGQVLSISFCLSPKACSIKDS